MKIKGVCVSVLTIEKVLDSPYHTHPPTPSKTQSTNHRNSQKLFTTNS